MSAPLLDRRGFLAASAAGLGAVAGCDERPPQARPAPEPDGPLLRRPYTGPNVIVIRFGGGVRRRETIDTPERTFCPFIYHELGRRQGVLFPQVDIAAAPEVVT